MLDPLSFNRQLFQVLSMMVNDVSHDDIMNQINEQFYLRILGVF